MTNYHKVAHFITKEGENEQHNNELPYKRHTTNN